MPLVLKSEANTAMIKFVTLSLSEYKKKGFDPSGIISLAVTL